MGFKPAYSYGLSKGFQHIMEGQYQIYGQLDIVDKKDDTSIWHQISLLYNGMIDQKNGRLLIEPFVTLRVLDEVKSMGMLYKTDETFVYKTPGQNSQYIYDDIYPSANRSDSTNTHDINQIFKTLREQVVDGGNEIMTIGRHTFEQKIKCKKFTLSLSKDHFITLFKQVMAMGESDVGQEVTTFIEREPFDIHFHMYSDQHYIYKIICILENEGYTITLTNQFEDYDKIEPIAIPEEANQGKNIQSLTPEEIESMLYELIDFIG